ncbi:transglycosylase domain-containing protein [Bacillus atrophaeus]|uniref:transglycosylase domain-containing protein n=1 Tax=Bacillus atrophaeus TaxID=1452 RepID=UPI000AAD46E7|nr:transglycosylase domain-containing protein [Bacillus atrophaeus]MCY8466089.1 penicillin-binding protein [Bacillus atrophaeus]MCY8477964.1 penicillin-binding protein [Bacillus atrophaeus]MCY8916062.1 penicillin-binding protein [Bacillus atrophaeus]MCY8923895.1 penicillin-binding protein [Bacillus atrophaeus]MCY8960475.1 penicillin-binding protein [Bacillus atrophaeus]
MAMLRSIIGWILLLCIIPLFAFTLIASGKEVKEMKSLDQVLDKNINLKKVSLVQNSYMYDRDGALVSEIVSDDENRVLVPYKKIPEEVKQLFLTSEDRHFYEHKGFDFMGMVRAAASNVKDQKIDQGASTITQQLSRNLYLSHERTFNRKLIELMYSYQLEKKLTKDEILESYLNTIYFNNGVYGVGSAAQFYFNKPLKSLTLGEMAFICAIPNNPTLYDPLKHFDYTKSRQERLLNGLKKAGVITNKQLKKALKEDIKLDVVQKKNKYPDYVTYVNEEFTQLVSSSEGFDKRLAKANDKEKAKIEKELSKKVSTLLKDGVKIYTALDPYMQNQVVAQVNQNLPYEGVQGGAAVVNHQTHQIVALSGGKNYAKYDFNRAYQAYRQPGSSIKPLLDYGPYIEKTGATASSSIDASKFCSKEYCPQNYNNRTYGTVTLDTAFKNSYNTPAIRMLDHVGVNTGFSYLKPFHFAELKDTDYVLPAALGGFTDGMSPLEMTNAFTTFGNSGSYTPSRAITKVTDLNGKTILKWKDKPVQVYSIRTNNVLRQLMASVVKSGTGKKANFKAPYVGGKTGTSNNYKDMWFVGLTDTYTMGVWVGKDNPGSVEYLHNAGPQLSIWRNTLQAAY